jgi:hypothetical protein
MWHKVSSLELTKTYIPAHSYGVYETNLRPIKEYYQRALKVTKPKIKSYDDFLAYILLIHYRNQWDRKECLYNNVKEAYSRAIGDSEDRFFGNRSWRRVKKTKFQLSKTYNLQLYTGWVGQVFRVSRRKSYTIFRVKWIPKRLKKLKFVFTKGTYTYAREQMLVCIDEEQAKHLNERYMLHSSNNFIDNLLISPYDLQPFVRIPIKKRELLEKAYAHEIILENKTTRILKYEPFVLNFTFGRTPNPFNKNIPESYIILINNQGSKRLYWLVKKDNKVYFPAMPNIFDSGNMCVGDSITSDIWANPMKMIEDRPFNYDANHWAVVYRDNEILESLEDVIKEKDLGLVKSEYNWDEYLLMIGAIKKKEKINAV